MRFQSAVFDFDSTLVDIETLEAVGEAALEGRVDREAVMNEIRKITELGLEGKIRFDESLSKRMALIAPHRAHVQKIADLSLSHITPSVLGNKDFFKHNADSIYIVSGGFDELIFPVSDILGIARAHVYANAFVYDSKGIATGVDISRPLSQQLGKIKVLRAAALPHPLAMVGDGFTDYEVKAHGEADVFIAYVEHTHRASVVANADYTAHSFGEVVEYLSNPHSVAR